MQQAEVLMTEGDLKAYDTKALNEISTDVRLRAIDIAGLPWIEIDSLRDLESAEREILPCIESMRSELRHSGKWARGKFIRH